MPVQYAFTTSPPKVQSCENIQIFDAGEAGELK